MDVAVASLTFVVGHFRRIKTRRRPRNNAIKHLCVQIDSDVNFQSCCAVLVAQLTARSLPIPEDQGSNPDFVSFYSTLNAVVTLFVEKDANKEKEAGNGQIKKI